ncbi:ABC transporter permease [Hoyosella sp. YIM 151337]|uniref:ABC transporter permease n=1 Tax=Hoyosella sp. YIM 151337 TaxID=2992742 RepID=UPI0022355B65|nr:ABC transporter permease [Hoyosella sp. YIM 151337]MCW4352423.1 ABC transporter permease [Hoyosella sp. YIM 151337]
MSPRISAFSLAQESLPGAGGAALDQILIVLVANAVIFTPLVWFVIRERSGHRTTIGRAADWVAKKESMPRWFSLPIYLMIASLLSAGFGVAWDIPIHMQDGRDEGPLANPAHYFIYFGIVGFFVAGVISMTLVSRRLPARTFRIRDDWRAPMGSMVIVAAGLIALAGFPLDDVWHRMFGQDVTQWGPTHTMMIGGAVTCVLGGVLLHSEARQVGAPGTLGLGGRIRGVFLLSTCIIPFYFLAEFELGLPQFPAATQFIIAGLLTTWIFTACRRYFGPGGALFAWGFYAIAQLFLIATISALPGVLVSQMLLFLPAALIVELVALVLAPARGVVFGLVCAVLIGTVGMYAEWLWSHAFMPLPQPLPSHALPLMLSVGTAAAIAGALIGHWHAQQLQRVEARSTVSSRLDQITFRSPLLQTCYSYWLRQQTPAPATRTAPGYWQRNGYVAVGGVVFLALMAAFAPPSMKDGVFADVELSENCDGTSICRAFVTITMDPAETDRAIWLHAYYWQGKAGTEGEIPTDPSGGAPGVMRVRMLPTGIAGQFRSEHELPMYGGGKTQIRLHQAPTVMLNLPLYAPDDPEISADIGRRILAESGQRYEFIYEPTFLQRETKDYVPGWLWATGYTVVLLLWLVTLVFYVWLYSQAAFGSDHTARSHTQPRGKPIDA